MANTSDRLVSLERDFQMARKDLETIESRPAETGSKRPHRLAEIESPVGAGFNTFNITFLDGTYTEVAGNQTPVYQSRQNVSAGVAHNLSTSSMSVGDVVVVHRWSNRWWFSSRMHDTSIVMVSGGHWEPGVGGETSGVAPIIGYVPIVGDMSLGSARNSGYVIYAVPVPQGSTITAATIDITQLGAGTTNLMLGRWAKLGTPANGTYNANGAVYGEDIDNASEYLTYTALDGATRTTANIVFSEGGVWTSPNWVPDHAAGSSYSITVTSIVQEIVNRAGWVSGNNMQFFYDESGSNFSNGSPKYAVWGVLSEYGTAPSIAGNLNVTWV